MNGNIYKGLWGCKYSKRLQKKWGCDIGDSTDNFRKRENRNLYNLNRLDKYICDNNSK